MGFLQWYPLYCGVLTMVSTVLWGSYNGIHCTVGCSYKGKLTTGCLAKPPPLGRKSRISCPESRGYFENTPFAKFLLGISPLRILFVEFPFAKYLLGITPLRNFSWGFPLCETSSGNPPFAKFPFGISSLRNFFWESPLCEFLLGLSSSRDFLWGFRLCEILLGIPSYSQ